MSNRVPTAILGSTGYVAGELLRLLAGHPGLALRAAASDSRAGEPIGAAFPHLAGCYGGESFSTLESVEKLVAEEGRVALFSCLPHGESAKRLAALLEAAGRSGCDLKVVDLAADFRLETAAAWEAVYGEPHGAPDWCGRFTCSVPEHYEGVPPGPVAHPGCFTTCVTTACHALQGLGVCEPVYSVAAVTGASGSGRTPRPGTHFPERANNFLAYSPLAHRHEAEMKLLIGRAGGEAPQVLFVPHSGPFSRGIHATIHVKLTGRTTTQELTSALRAFYAGKPFITVKDAPPTLKEVVGTNEVRLGAVVRGDRAVVFSVIDNLTKGAAGGGLQWMNRLLGFEETAGLRLCGMGWH